MGIGITATVGFHIIVKEPSEEDNIDISSIEVKLYGLLRSFVIIYLCLDKQTIGFQDACSKMAEKPLTVLGKTIVPCLLPTAYLTNTILCKVAAIYMSTRLFVNLSQAYIPFYLQVIVMFLP